MDTETDTEYSADKLAVAITRPSTKLGVPFLIAVGNFVASLLTVIFTQNVLWLGLCVPLHGICYLITQKDPRAFELLRLWLRTKLATLVATRWYWSVSSYSPLTFRERPGRFQRWRIARRLSREK